MSVIAMIICGLFLAAVWRVKLPDDLSQLANNDQGSLQRRERGLVVAAAPEAELALEVSPEMLMRINRR